MKDCLEVRDNLLLDLYGELDPDERPALEAHLDKCSGCREERRSLLLMLDRVREGLPPARLSPEDGRALNRAIRNLLNNRTSRAGSLNKLLRSPHKLLPLAAAVSTLVIAFAWFTLKGPSPMMNSMNSGPAQQFTVTEKEIIYNLEMLEEMETLERLVQVVDEKDII